MLRHCSLSCLLSFALGACGSEAPGDDLPPGAFTTGVDAGDLDVGSGSGTTSGATSVVVDDSGSSSTTTPVQTSGDKPDVISHEEHILPIWIEQCGTNPICHDADAPASNLDLASDGVYARICDGFHGFSGMSYIDCDGGDPQASYIFRKLEGTHLAGDISGASGVSMPPSGPLSDADLTLIECWITEGALP